MAMFLVYEVHEERVIRRWTYAVEAASAEGAIERATAGEAEAIDCGDMGEADYSSSGWTARENGSKGDDEAWEEAVQDMMVNLDSA